MLRSFIAFQTIASAGFEPANFGSNGKHATHYTTKATIWGGSFTFPLIVIVKRASHSCCCAFCLNNQSPRTDMLRKIEAIPAFRNRIE
jgi:hypothetical protein